jgi:tripartite-type tricarboxylate transporter receptor subunit TctC
MTIKPWKRFALVGVAAAMAGGLAAGASAAVKKPANYPKRPVTIIVCFGKGGGSDQAVAALQEPAAKIMGVKINKVNKPGGGGLNCLPDFMQAPADGYTILQHADTLVSKYVGGDMDIHPTRDLSPVVISNVAPTGLFIKGDDKRFMTNGKPDFDKLVAYAKKNPGKLSVSNINVPMELVTMSKVEGFFGIKVKQVLFDKPAARYGAVIGGKLDVLMEQPGDVIKHVKAGKLAPVLAVWPDRFKVFPDTKATGADYGKKWDPLLRIRGLWVKNDTPQAIKDYLDAVFKEAYNSKKHQAFLTRKSLNIVNSYYGSADTKKILDNTISVYAKIFKTTGQKLRKDMQ